MKQRPLRKVATSLDHVLSRSDIAFDLRIWGSIRGSLVLADHDERYSIVPVEKTNLWTHSVLKVGRRHSDFQYPYD